MFSAVVLIFADMLALHMHGICLTPINRSAIANRYAQTVIESIKYSCCFCFICGELIKHFSLDLFQLRYQNSIKRETIRLHHD